MPTTKTPTTSTKKTTSEKANSQSEAKKTTTHEMPPISTLFQESWSLIKKSWLAMLGMGIYSFVGIMLSMLVFGIIAFQFGLNLQFFESLAKNDLSVLTNIQLYKGLGIGFLVYVFIASIIQYSYLAGTTIILKHNREEKDNANIINAITSSFKFIIPLFLLGLVMFFLSMGGLMVFIFPSIIFGILFSFSFYEVVLQKKSIMESLKSSYQIVASNFGAIFLRFIAIYGVYFIISFIIPDVISGLGESAQVANVFYSFTVGIAMGWYMTIYVYCLYEQAKKATDKDKKVSLAWVFVVAVVGWLLLFSVVSSVSKMLKSQEFRENIMQGFSQAFDQSNSQGFKLNLDENENDIVVLSDNPEIQTTIVASNKLFQQMIQIQNDPNSQAEITKINDENIKLLKEALKNNPESAELWYQLSNAFTWTNTVGNLEDGLQASLKAEEIDPENQAYITQVGLYYSRLNMNEKAILQLNKALRMDESNPSTYEFLGDAYSNLKIYDKARDNYRKSLELFNEINIDGSLDGRILSIESRLARI